MELVDPKQFIITRKRKKYKFALFHNSQFCFEYEQWQNLHTHNAVNLQGQILQWWDANVVEVGAGNGRFAVELAARHPNQKLVALDVKGDRLQQGARIAEERGLENIRFVRARADQIGELFAPNSLSAIWVTFADPFPRKRSAGRRMTHPTYLKKYAELLCASGSINIKHDNPVFFAWTLEQLVTEGWHIAELSFDLHDSDELEEEYKVMTSYEARWLSEGRVIQFAKATPPRTTSGG